MPLFSDRLLTTSAPTVVYSTLEPSTKRLTPTRASPQRWTPFKKHTRASSTLSPPSTTTSSSSKNPSLLTIPHSLQIRNNPDSARSRSSPTKSSYSPSIIAHHHHHHHHHHHLPHSATTGRATPVPGLRSSSALSHISFRSLRSVNSRIKVRIQSLSQAIEARNQKPELDWSSFRAEYELHLARGSIIERCLVQVDLGPTVTERGRTWIDSVWTLADRLSPPLPAALAQSSASGLLPLLCPLRQTIHELALELPYNYLDDTEEFEKFRALVAILKRAIWLAKLIENVIEVVSQVGLVKFELAGLSDKSSIYHDQSEFDQFANQETSINQYHHAIEVISHWPGEIKGRTGSGQHWRGTIKVC